MIGVGMKDDIPKILAKGIFGTIPIAGPLISEIVGSLIPNQRMDRIERLLH